MCWHTEILTFPVKVLQLFLWLLVTKIKQKKPQTTWHPASCWCSFACERFWTVNSSMGSTWVWWDQATLCSPLAVGICFLSVGTETGSAVLYQTKIRLYCYTCMCLSANSWQLEDQSMFIGAVFGNALGTKRDFGDFFGSEPAVSVWCV